MSHHGTQNLGISSFNDPNYYNGLADHPENINNLWQKSPYQRYIMYATLGPK